MVFNESPRKSFKSYLIFRFFQQLTATGRERCRRESRPEASPDLTPDPDRCRPEAGTSASGPGASTPTSSRSDLSSARPPSRSTSPDTSRTRPTSATGLTAMPAGQADQPAWQTVATGSVSLHSRSGQLTTSITSIEAMYVSSPLAWFLCTLVANFYY